MQFGMRHLRIYAGIFVELPSSSSEAGETKCCSPREAADDISFAEGIVLALPSPKQLDCWR